MHALLDADIFVYRVGFTTNEEPAQVAISLLDNMIEECLAAVGAESFTCYLSDSTKNGFRYKLYPEYKANRTQEKPKHYQALRDHLVSFWNAIITEGQEADDALGIDQSENNKKLYSYNIGGGKVTDFGLLKQQETIICSIDKDLFQIPGNHYNFVTKQFNFITEEQGLYFFYKQVLMGDPSDNIGGLKGIGPKKAEKILGEVGQDEHTLLNKVWNAYNEVLGEKYFNEVRDILTLTAQLVKIRTKENEFWEPPKKIQFNTAVETEPHS